MYGKILLAVIIVYCNLTTLEWFVHKYVMHGYDRINFPVIGKLIDNESSSHLAHHHEVLSDMSLDIQEKEETEKGKGLFFHHEATILFTVVLYVFLTIQFKLFKIKTTPKIVIGISLFSTIGYSFLWNNFHSLLHGEHEIIIPGTEGVTNRYQDYVTPFIPSFWFDWMLFNHAQHHAVKGKSKGNYNIILPGFDYIMGTYNLPPCFDNTTFCESSDLKSCDKPKGCFKVENKKLSVTFRE